MYHILVNPGSRSGLGRKQWRELKKLLDLAKITYIVHFSKSEKELLQYTRSITDPQIYIHNRVPVRIIVLGGDGTLNCVLNGIADLEHTIIHYLPTGTSNDFARALGITSGPARTVSALRKGNPVRQTDIGIASYGHTKRRFAVSSGIGYDAVVCHEIAHAPAKKLFNRLGLGRISYLMVALWQFIFLKPVSADLYLDDKPALHFDRLYFSTFMQLPYEGGGFKLCPRADSADNMLDICVVADIPKWKALPIFPMALKGTHTDYNGIRMYRAKKVRIVTSRPLCVHTDGETDGYYTQMELSVSEQKLLYRK